MVKEPYDADNHLDWQQIISYDAPYNIIVDVRGRGKTYGLRKQCVRQDFMKRGKRYVELTRQIDELKGSKSLQTGYYDRFYDEFEDDIVMRDMMLDIRGRQAYIAKRPQDAKAKPKWEVLAYFLALNEAQDVKKRSTAFRPVRRFIFDEAIIDKSLPGSRYKTYLPGEIEAVASIMSSVCRERPETEERDRPRLYLLGNACDITCPWFAHFGITDEPPLGFSWHYNKRCLVYYAKSNAEWAKAQDASVAGGLIAGTEAGRMAAWNEFSQMDPEYFANPPKGSELMFGIVHQGCQMYVYENMNRGLCYVTSRKPKNDNGKPIYALTTEDSKPNYIQASRMQRSIRGFAELYYAGILRYENPVVRENFLRAMRLYGVR